MKTKILTGVVVLALFVIAFSSKMTNDEEIQRKRDFGAEAGGGDMLRVTVYGRSYDIDIFEYPNEEGEVPRGGMTYEMARQACESAGKRLCTDMEWREACHGAGLDKYSYGNDFERELCNTLHLDRRARPSGYFAECRTAEGLYDMSGNLWEWVEQSETSALLAKGGSYRDGELAQRCEHTLKLFEVQLDELSLDNFGARCCRDAGGE